MKKLFFLLMSIMFCSSIIASGESTTDNNSLDVIDQLGLTVRQSADNANITAITKPALFQIVWPGSGDKSPSYSLDIGVMMKEPLFKKMLFGNFSPTVEYHRHTDISKPQDSFQAGLLGGSSVTENVYIQEALTYKRDNVVSGNGLVGKFDILPLSTSLAIG